jgi:predicted amidohydrolase YtcJ
MFIVLKSPVKLSAGLESRKGDVMADKIADLILSGGKVYPLNTAGTTATAIAVSKGRILATGSDDEIEKLAGPGARRIDLAGTVVLPGLIDSHFHVCHVGHASQAAFLYDAWSIAEILDRLKEHAEKTPGAVTGVGGNFHETSLAEGRLPTATDLDMVATDRPVVITDVNKTVVNSFVLRQLDTDDVPPGGEVPKDQSGRPLGIFFYAAKRMTPLGGQGDATVTQAISTEEAIMQGLRSAARMGLTGVLDAQANLEIIAAYRAIEREQGLPIRASIMPRDVTPAELERIGASAGLREGRLTFGPIKLAFDLWIMHRTAMMYESYVGQPDNFGMSRVSEEKLQQQIDEAFSAGWPVGIHTTGDRGIDIVASAIENGIEKAGEAPGRCHLIHVYFPPEKALEIASRHNLAIAAQPTFIHTWGETVRAFVGQERAERFKPLRTMLDWGLTVGGGADSPITWHNPWVGIYAAATRKTEGGSVLGEREQITVEEALRCYTLGSAAILEEGNIRGSIEVGKMADFTVVDRDILAIDPEQIPATKVLKTIVGGEVVYEA